MLWRPKPSDPYRVLFRLDGRKFNRSTGETNYAAAQRKALRSSPKSFEVRKKR